MRTLSLVILVLWVLTFVRTLVNLLTLPRLQPRLPRRFPLVSVIIPARNEERTIGRTVAGLLAQTWPALEIIVVNDRSEDATGDVLARYSDPRLRVVNGVDPPEGWLGKPWALHQGTLEARGELLLFIDADVIYSPDAVAAAVARLEESGIAMLSLFPHLEMRGFWEHVIMPGMAFVAYSAMPLWLANRSRAVWLAIGGGPGNLIRREVYDRMGGHEALRDAVIDDIGLARLVRRGGDRTEVVRADNMISIRMYHGGREIVDGFTKNAFPLFNRNYAVVLLLTAVLMVAHFLPYVLALTGDPLAIATVVLISVTRLVLFRACSYRLDNALLAHPLMMGAWFWIVLRSMWFTGVRRRLTWRGRHYDAARTRSG